MLGKFNIREKVLEVVFKWPTTEFTVRDLAKRVKASAPTISKIVKDLEKEGIVKIKKEKNYFKITGNVENEKFRELKRAYNILSLSELKNEIVRNVSPNLICVFGSYAFGEDIEDSDIDIFVEADKYPDIDLSTFERKLNRKIHLIVGRLEKMPKELKESILSGVVLYGSVKI